jgi:hypothetical protein
MFLRATIRKKDGKEHRYWSLVENKRVSGGRVLQRHVLYLSEIYSSQELAWRKSIEVFEDGADRPRSLALFPEDRCEGRLPDASIVRLKLTQVRLSRPAMGCMLVGCEAVGRAAARSFLGRTIAGEPQGHTLGPGAAGSGGVPADRSGFGMAAAS